MAINCALPTEAFHPYALGYLEAAITLGQAAIRRPSDLAFYPPLHLFRPGLELALKPLAFHAAKYHGDARGGGSWVMHSAATVAEPLNCSP